MSSWISGNFWLTQEEMQNNAVLLWSYFKAQGWTLNAVAAMLGNMQSESTINPGIWEGLDPFVGGYGLVQWTPYTKYSDWAGSGWEDNGPKECERIVWELENGVQWYPTEKYPMTFEEFSKSTDPVGVLAQAFLYNYDRPADIDQPWRSTQAEYWFEFLGGVPSIPVWLLFKFNKRRLYG